MQFLGVLLVCVSCASAAVPSYIKPCAVSDPKFNDCTLEHAKQSLADVIKGDRKLKISSMDPLEITELKQEDAPKDSVALTLNDIKLLGFKDTRLQKAQFDLKKNRAVVEFNVPVLTLLAKYDIKGRLLILPITGNGDLNNTSIEPKFTFEADLKDLERDGKHYLQLDNPTIEMVPKRVYHSLTNLFNGNELLAKEMNDFIDKNWEEVHKEVSPPVRQAIAEIIVGNVNKLFMSAPRDEFLPQTL